MNNHILGILPLVKSHLFKIEVENYVNFKKMPKKSWIGFFAKKNNSEKARHFLTWFFWFFITLTPKLHKKTFYLQNIAVVYKWEGHLLCYPRKIMHRNQRIFGHFLPHLVKFWPFKLIEDTSSYVFLKIESYNVILQKTRVKFVENSLSNNFFRVMSAKCSSYLRPCLNSCCWFCILW